MLRSRGLTDKLLVLGVDGMDPRWAKRMVDEGKMPHLKELMERGACRDDLMLLGANPTITPPMRPGPVVAAMACISESVTPDSRTHSPIT